MVTLLKEMMGKLGGELSVEQRDRETAEDALLRLLEDTCVKLNQKQ